MELIKPGTNIDFIRHAKAATGVSLLLILAGLVSIWYHGGLNYGVDFAGGTVVHVKFTRPTTAADVRQAFRGSPIAADLTVQDFGREGNEFLLRLPTTADSSAGGLEQVRQHLAGAFGEQGVEIRRVESVGPRVGSDLRRKALLAVTFATVMMGVYLTFRFDLRFGVGAAVALLHDVLITIGALSLMDMEVDLTTIAALLTVVGFSVNDTVVICDRIRENLRKLRREPLAAIINRSINETLSRTIITNGTAILTVVTLFALGGAVIHTFAFALLVGFIAGTYSTIYIATPVVLLWERTARR